MLHRCALTGDIAFYVTVTEDNRYEMSSIWNQDCDYPGGLTTEVFYSGDKLPPPGERYLERARLRRERKKQKYNENEAHRIKATMHV